MKKRTTKKVIIGGEQSLNETIDNTSVEQLLYKKYQRLKIDNKRKQEINIIL